MDLLVVQGQVGTLLGVTVGIEAMLLTNAQMRDVLAVLVDDFTLGIVEAKLAVLDAKLPATTHGLVVILDAEGLAFGHADLAGLTTASTDGVVDACETRVSDRGHPISIGPASILLVGGAGAKAVGGKGSCEVGTFGGRSRSRSEDARRRQHCGKHERESHSWSETSLNLKYLKRLV